MPIIRSRHTFDTQFTQIPNAWVRDPRISLKAKGLLVQLLSHTPGWTVSIGSLANANGCGKDAIRSAVIELEQVGYLKRTTTRTTEGQFSEVLWETSDPTDNPSTDNPPTDNPPTKNNNLKEEQPKEVLPQPTVEVGLDEKFGEFWAIYPRRVERLDAQKAFRKAYAQYGDVILTGARRLSQDPNLPPKQFVPYPASWLRAGGWENEPYPERQKSKEELLTEEKRRVEERNAREKALAAQKREQAKREAEEFVPPPRCEHGRLTVRCPLCREDDTPEE